MRRTFDEIETLAYITNDKALMPLLVEVEELIERDCDWIQQDLVDANEELKRTEDLLDAVLRLL